MSLLEVEFFEFCLLGRQQGVLVFKGSGFCSILKNRNLEGVALNRQHDYCSDSHRHDVRKPCFSS